MNAGWIAGLFEGEGCIYKDPRCNSWRLTINMTDQDVLEKFANAVGIGKVTTTTKKPGYKDMYTWTLSRRADVRQILEQMLPWLGFRRGYAAQNCIDAIDLCTSHSPAVSTQDPA